MARSEFEQELPLLNILLHCRTVVEGKSFLTTGVMTNVEGELFEVELHEFEQFELGETVKLTIYSPAGIQSMPSVVFAKYEGAIALLQPPDLLKRFKERREHPRVEIDGTAQIVQVLNGKGEELPVAAGMEIKINDISVSGINLSAGTELNLATGFRLKAQVDIGFVFNCELVIVRRDRQEDHVHYGASMHLLEPEMLRPLRALVLRQQVEKNAQSRREIVSKRKFNG